METNNQVDYIKLNTILVLGGAGYLGSVLVPLLLEKGYNVRVLDNLMFNQTSLLSNYINEKFQMINGDVRDEGLIQKSLINVDAIIHLAALVGAPLCSRFPKMAESTNVDGTRIINEVRDPKKQPIIFASTTSLYGHVNGKCNEDHELNPTSLYGQTKKEAESILQESENYLIYRFATLFGVSPKMRLDLLLNNFVHQAVKNQSLVVYQHNYIRSLMHVRDAANAILFALPIFNKIKNNVYNCGSEKMNLSKGEIVSLIKKQVYFDSIYREFSTDQDNRNYFVEYNKIKSIGFEPRMSINDGIKELIKCYETTNFNVNNTNYPL